MSLIIYNSALFIYALLLRIAAVFNPKAKLFVDGRKDVFSKIKLALEKESRPVVWIHCASLGEFEQGRPVIEKIKAEQPEYCIFLTFFSPSGYEIRKHYELADYVFYLPLDTRKNAKYFLEILKPQLALFVKYELWFNYLCELNKQKIPVLLFSAYFQKKQVFFQWYGSLHRQMLGFFKHIFVQDECSVELLKTIQIQNASVAGDTRIDRALIVLEDNTKVFENIVQFKGSHQLIIAGSTWPEDEQLLKEFYDSSIKHNYKLLLAPHIIKEENIARLLQLFSNDICLWNADAATLSEKSIAIVNTIGHLAFIYKYANVAWIGGGFNKSGIHNIIEPAVFGIPVFFGPNYSRFLEAKELISIKAASSIENASEFTSALEDTSALIEKGKLAQDFVFNQRGATQIITSYLFEKCLDITL